MTSVMDVIFFLPISKVKPPNLCNLFLFQTAKLSGVILLILILIDSFYNLLNIEFASI